MISAKILADSVNPQGDRLTTMEVVLPRIILAEDSHELYELRKQCFLNGAKWQQERMYSEEEVKRLCSKAWLKIPNTPNMLEEFDKWFEQFKKNEK